MVTSVSTFASIRGFVIALTSGPMTATFALGSVVKSCQSPATPCWRRRARERHTLVFDGNGTLHGFSGENSALVAALRRSSRGQLPQRVRHHRGIAVVDRLHDLVLRSGADRRRSPCGISRLRIVRFPIDGGPVEVLGETREFERDIALSPDGTRVATIGFGSASHIVFAP
jgi:hypothetical protein